MSTPTQHNLQHAMDAVKNNPDVPPNVLLNNPYKNWDDEAKAFLRSGAPQAASTALAARSRFRSIAEAAFARGEIRILPLAIGGKNPSIKWANTPSNIANGVDTRIDTLTTEQWAAVAGKWVDDLAPRFADLNACVVAKPDEFVFVDCDTHREFITGYEAFSGEKFPATYTTSARENRTQIHFRQTDATRALGNLPQFKSGDVELSIRQRNEYVLAEGSQHPSGSTYVAVVEGPIAPMPDKLVEYIRYLKSAMLKKDSSATASTPAQDNEWVSAEQNLAAIPRNANGKMTHGSYHGAMLTVAGYWRAKGLEADAIEEKLVAYANENFQPPVDFEKVKQMSVSICNFPLGEEKSVALTQKPSISVAPVTANLLPSFKPKTYPVFPSFVMEGTSIYEGFVKPYCKVNSRIPFFMWAPAAAMFMNYLGTKVRVALKSWKPSFYLVLIGEKDRAHKSSSIKDGMKYLEFAGLLSMYSKEIRNADGKALVWEAGSPEGLGTDMQRTNCHNTVLFYDELSTLVSKSQIEGSGMMGALLKMYESNNFSNSVKTKKDAFSVAPDSYVATVITATTDQRFHELWGRFAGDDTGLNTRFTFILQPKELPEEELEEVVPFFEATEKTKARASAAINQGVFEFDYGFDGKEMLKECQKTCGGRAEIRAEKWALYFAIDLGKTVIDSECIERGVALVNYEREVKKYLATEEAATKSAGLQQKMVQLLERNNGRVPEHGAEGFRALTGERKYGTDMWRKAFFGLVNENVLKQENGDVVMVRSWGGNHD